MSYSVRLGTGSFLQVLFSFHVYLFIRSAGEKDAFIIAAAADAAASC